MILFLPPSSFQSAFFHQSLIVSRQHMGFNLLDRIQSHTDHDEQSCPSKIEGDIEPSDQDGGENADDRDINRSTESNSSEHLVNILSRLLSRPEAWNITAKLLHIFGDIIWIEGNRRIKVAEENDESYIEKVVEKSARSKTIQERLNPGMGL